MLLLEMVCRTTPYRHIKSPAQRNVRRSWLTGAGLASRSQLGNFYDPLYPQQTTPTHGNQPTRESSSVQMRFHMLRDDCFAEYWRDKAEPSAIKDLSEDMH